LKAVNEETGWKHIRKAHLNELFISINDAPVQIKDKWIRAADRSELCSPVPVGQNRLPKLMYTAVRMRGLAAVYRKGVSPLGGLPYILLSDNRAQAEKIGYRYDQRPAILVVHSSKTLKQKINFLQFGDTLFLAKHLPPVCFDGPGIPKEKAATGKSQKNQEKKVDKTPGSYFPEIPDIPGYYGKKAENKTGWKRNKKRRRRSRIKKWPDE